MTYLTEQDQTKVINRLVEISLFTWRRAEDDDPYDEQRFGWWGDSYPPVSNHKIGSRLWLLTRRKLTDETIRDARCYIEEALQWLKDDFVVLDFSVELSRVGLDQLKAIVTCNLKSNKAIYIVNDMWSKLNAL